jgi:predicted nucleic acid-binding protein
MLVVDASVAVKWVLDEEGADAARALHTEHLTSPSLWLIEAANALWATAARGQISAKETEERLAGLRHAPVETTPAEVDLPSALQIANRLRHPIYDCLYLAAALRLNTHVVTADRRFVWACANNATLKRRVKLL